MILLVISAAGAGCRDVTADRFPASVAGRCPPGFSVADGRCHRSTVAPVADGAADDLAGGGSGGGGSSGATDGAGGNRGSGGSGMTGPLDAGGGGGSDAASGPPTDTAPPSDAPSDGPSACPPATCPLKASALAAGADSTCALRTDGTVLCW